MTNTISVASILMRSPDCISISYRSLPGTVNELMDTEDPQLCLRGSVKQEIPEKVRTQLPKLPCSMSATHVPSFQLTCTAIRVASCKSTCSIIGLGLVCQPSNVCSSLAGRGTATNVRSRLRIQSVNTTKHLAFSIPAVRASLDQHRLCLKELNRP